MEEIKVYKDGKIWLALNDADEEIYLLPGKANRHGLVAGATGTGKTVTLKVLAEAFSDMGVPVFLADVKGDIAGLMAPGTDSEDMRARIERFGLAENGFSYQGYPVTFWDIYGQKGIQLRTTVSEMGPLLLARILKLNELQTNILSIIFKIADDNGLLLIDTKDLKAMLNHVNHNHKEYEAQYGKMSSASIAAILRAVVALEIEGGETFFGEPGLNIHDWIRTENGKGMINILDSESLINSGRLYSTFLLWMLSELFEMLPEVGNPDKPKMVFFFDEAHLLFNDAPKSLLEKIEQVVKLIRSKGVGVYFCTQNPRDIPDGVLAQLSNRIQHALRAYTPADQKSVRSAADSFRENPAFNTFDTIMALGTGEAVISLLQEDGTPGIAQKARVLPPQSRMGAVSDYEREAGIRQTPLYAKYAEAVDPESAFEILERLGLEKQAEAERLRQEAEKAKAEAAEARQREKEEAAAAKAAQREAEKAEREAQREAEKAEREAQREAEREAAAKKKAAKSVGSTVAGTVGREVGKTVGGTIGGKFGKTLGGNLGASLGRGILNTLFGR